MRAIALFSGGLDSQIACRLVASQGIEVVAVYFDLGFGKTDKTQFLRAAALDAHASLLIKNISDEYVENVLFSPKYGYGKAFNPCIDCHGFMFKKAGEMLGELDAKFLISGEVLGERPMSQNKNALDLVKRLSGFEKLILRPLSAKLLPPSLPEQMGWIEREKLLGLSGRSRKTQLELAQKYGFKEYETPGGGCLLTESFFKTKMQDLLKFDSYKKEDAIVLRFGRHFRLTDGAKLVLGRNEQENKIFEKNAHIFTKYELIFPESTTLGPTALVSKNVTQNDKILALEIIASYCKTQEKTACELRMGSLVTKIAKTNDKTFYREYLLA